MFFLSFPRSAPVRKPRKKSFLFCAQGRRKTKTFQFFQKSLHLPLYKIEISGIIIIVRCASVAQSVEQGTENPRVIGSIPIGGTSQGNPAGFPICGRSSSGRAPPCQGGGSEFEPRRPLQYEAIVDAEMQKRWLFCCFPLRLLPVKKEKPENPQIFRLLQI